MKVEIKTEELKAEFQSNQQKPMERQEKKEQTVEVPNKRMKKDIRVMGTKRDHGKTSWPNKEKSLMVSLREVALYVLQALRQKEIEDYEKLLKRLEMRYGYTHLQQIKKL